MTRDAEAVARLLALAERVEKAEGPDRDTDALIVAAITPGVVGLDEAEPLGEDWCNRLYCYEPTRNWSDSWLPVPAYTSSVDAAIELIPEPKQHAWEVSYYRRSPSADFGYEAKARLVRGAGATPALALCAAALRARAALLSRERA